MQINEHQSLIDKQIQCIKQQNNAIKPYLISSFNKEFDNLLKTLVMEYEFDFDKVALHLYFLFPVYEQKITSRTVGVRWWQLMMGDRILRGIEQGVQVINDNEHKGQQKEVKKQEHQSQYEDVEQQKLMNPLQQTYDSKGLNRLRQDSVSVYPYRQALQQCLVLQQEQWNRLIMYKPKFIIDSQYKLQRYEMFDQESNNKENGNRRSFPSMNINDNDNTQSFNNNAGNKQIHKNKSSRQEMGIQSMLMKVVSNQFIYDEFGSFVNMINQEANSTNIKVQEKNINWWQQQIFSSQSSQPQDLHYIEENNQQECNNRNNEQKIDNSYNKLTNQEYSIEDNWDQYQSD